MKTDISQKVGHLLMVGIQGQTLDSASKDFLSEIRPNGVILFARNIESPKQIGELNHDLQEFALNIGLDPLFIAVDQEGGRVRRLLEPFSEFPPSWEMAKSSSPEDSVRDFAFRTATELRLAGFNLDFVPVLDVVNENVDLKSTVIGDRSFGGNPETVAHLGNIVTHEMRSQGVIPCAKHFPGHGATTVDSHFDLPVDERSLQDLEARDLIPFKQAVQNKIEMIMTAHVLFPKLDPDNPATMSCRILDNLLRKRFGYEGIIITDDLDMGAVSKSYPTDTCVVESFNAGADILLICNSQDKALAALAALRNAIRNRQIDTHQVSVSIKRIESLKRKFNGSFRPCDSSRLLNYFSNLNKILCGM